MGNLMHVCMALGFACCVSSNLESVRRKGESLGTRIVLGLLLFTLTLWTIEGVIHVAKVVFT